VVGPLGCVVNLLCAPLVLPWNACAAYLLPCVDVLVNRALDCVRASCCCCCPRHRLFVDAEFPATAASLGKVPGAKEARPAKRFERATS
jgi:hypothetical protein